jgi:hypothetical protein
MNKPMKPPEKGKHKQPKKIETPNPPGGPKTPGAKAGRGEATFKKARS